MQLLLRYCSVYPILFARVEIRQDGHSTMCTMTDRPRSKSAKQLSLYLFGHLYYCLYLIATLNPTNIECARMSHSQSGSWLPPFPHRVVLSHSAARAEQPAAAAACNILSARAKSPPPPRLIPQPVIQPKLQWSPGIRSKVRGHTLNKVYTEGKLRGTTLKVSYLKQG